MIDYFYSNHQFKMVRSELMYKEKQPRKNAKAPNDSSIQKRKKVVLNFKQKEEIIKKLRDGCSTKKLVLYYDVGLSTIYDINKTADSLAKYRTEKQKKNRNKLKKRTFIDVFS